MTKRYAAHPSRRLLTALRQQCFYPAGRGGVSRGVTTTSSFCDRRSTVNGTGLPTRSSVISRCNSSMSATGMPSAATMMSPLVSPAARAAPSGAVDWIAHRGLARQFVKAHDAARQRHVLPGDADIAAPHPALADQPRGDKLDRRRRDRKADTLRHADDRGVDADDLAGGGYQRPAGIARVQRRVGLDHAVDQPARAGAQRAAEGADDAGRYRALKAERVADRDHQLTDPQLPRIAEPGKGRGVAVEPQHREVGVGIVADQVRGEAAPVGKGRLDLARALTRRGCWSGHRRRG